LKTSHPLREKELLLYHISHKPYQTSRKKRFARIQKRNFCKSINGGKKSRSALMKGQKCREKFLHFFLSLLSYHHSPITNHHSRIHDLPAIRMQHLAGDIRRIIACKEKITGRNFSRFAHPFHGDVTAEGGHFLFVEAAHDQWCPDGTRCHGVNPDALVDEIMASFS
jgi:hypothetical protein